MRNVYLYDHDGPPNEADLAAAAAAGAGELISGIPPALAALRIDSFGHHEIDDAPAEPARRLIPKSVVQERAEAAGKLEDVMALLTAPGNAVYFARWFAPDWPNVYFDDPQMLTMLAGVGCTEEQIAAITAPV